MLSKTALRLWTIALAVLVAAAMVVAQAPAGGSAARSTAGAATATDASQAPAGESALPSETRPLPPYSAVTLCAPLNLLVRPGSDYAFTVAAEQPLLSKIAAEVGSDARLRVTVTGPFETNQTVQLTLTMPSDALKSTIHSGPGASLYVFPGFNASSTSVNFTTTFGAGQLYVDGLTANAVDVRHGGIGPAVLRGTLQTVTATTASLAPLYLSGVQRSARLSLDGTASAVVDQAPGSAITGSASGINTVTYSSGSCSIDTPFSAFPGFGGCVQAPFAAPPPPQPVWSCGLRAEGNFTCAPGTLLTQGPGGVASQSVGGQGGAAVQTGTSGTGGASAASSASSTTSGQGGGSSFVSTTQTSQGGGAIGPTTTTTITRNGQTQTLGGQGTGGASVAFEGASGETASVVSLPCAAPADATRIQWQ